jgi:hypothetical protein
MDHQEWTIQRKQKGPSRMDNPEKTKGTIKNGQSRENRWDHQEWINPETLLTFWYELKPKNNTEK